MKNPTKFETASETYQVAAVIGEGGAGRVFVAVDSSGIEYAVKCLRPDQVATDRRRRFKNELAFLRRNFHPNIVTVLDDGLVNWGARSTPFYVMPLYTETLRSRLKMTSKPGQMTAALSQILDGVEAAHLQGVIHRDLKPENILFDERSSRYVVADFGVANFQEEALLTAVETRAQDRLANFLYAAPEQRIRGGVVTRAADIFALGLICNEMITGEIIQGTGFRTIQSVAPELAYLDEVVGQMVRQDPGARYASIDELKGDLIGRKNTSIARQQVDALRRQVVPKYRPGEIAPVTVAGVDWSEGSLMLTLSRVPEDGWVQRFRNPREGYTSLQGAGPNAFSFSGVDARVRCEARNAQTVIDHFKNYLTMATRGFQQEVNQASEQQERQERMRLEAARRAAAERAEVVSKLKI